MPTENPQKITVEQVREKLGPRFERFFLKDVAVMLMQEARGEFSPEIQEILDKKGNGISLSSTEQREFNKAISRFWEDKFGSGFEQISEKSSGKGELKSDKRKDYILERSGVKKIKKMEALHQAIKNLDEGEIVQEFADETRRIIYI